MSPDATPTDTANTASATSPVSEPVDSDHPGQNGKAMVSGSKEEATEEAEGSGSTKQAEVAKGPGGDGGPVAEDSEAKDVAGSQHESSASSFVPATSPTTSSISPTSAAVAPSTPSSSAPIQIQPRPCSPSPFPSHSAPSTSSPGPPPAPSLPLQPIPASSPSNLNTSTTPASTAVAASTTASAPSSPAPRRPPPPTKGILKPPPPPPKPTFTNRLRDLAANVVGVGSGSGLGTSLSSGGGGGAGASIGGVGGHTGVIGGRGMYEPAAMAQAQARAQEKAQQSEGYGLDARVSAAGQSERGGPDVGRGAYMPGGGRGGFAPNGQPGQQGQTTQTAQTKAEQRIQEVSAAVGGTLGALSGKLGLGISRFVNAATSNAPASASPSPAYGASSGGSSGAGNRLNGRTLFDTDTARSASTRGTASSVSLPLPGSASAPSYGSGLDGDMNRDKRQPLRRATFVLPSLSIIYPISTYGEPWSHKVTEDRKRVESSHRSLISATTGSQYWTSHRLVLLYETACKGREERSRVGIVRALENLPTSPYPRTLSLLLRPFDLSTPAPPPPPYTLDTPLTRHAAEALADVLTIEWGLTELKLEGGCIEEEAALKSVLHALLVSGTLPTLSLAGNRKVRSGGWRLLSVFLRRARSLRYIDLSDTSWDKRSMEYLSQALSSMTPPISAPATCVDPPAPVDIASTGKPVPADSPNEMLPPVVDAYGSFLPPAPLLRNGEDAGQAAAVETLRMDGCNLRHNVLEVLANGVRTSGIKNLSLRRNRIGPLGGVSLAVMIRDYPDASATARPSISASGTTTTGDVDANPNGYAVRIKELPFPPQSAPNGRISPALYDSPNTANQIAEREGVPKSAEMRLAAATSSAMDSDMTSGMRRHVGKMDAVKRVGRLLTLDLKGNDLRTGVQYIAQVLKRNRTLKVLNLSDNRVESAGLAVLAEALKYNSTLETLDLSSNPCCGPGTEGIAALRSALTTNTSLKRLFLSDTGLTAEGAISLAEVLPETNSLLHFDLTVNPIELAGAIALSSGLKSNTTIRCLDVTVSPSDSDMADAGQAILQTCIRNTELAVATVTKSDSSDVAHARSADAIWLPIKRSALVRQAKEADEYRAEQARVNLALSTQGLAREYVYKLSPSRLVPAAERTGRDLEKWIEAGRIARRPGWTGAWQPGQLPKEEFDVLVERAKVLKERLVDEAQRIPEEEADGAVSKGIEHEQDQPQQTEELGGMDLLIRIIELKESLEAVLDDTRGFTPPPRLLLPSQIVTAPTVAPPTTSIGNGQPPMPMARHRRHVRGASLEISSPNFSIGDSDNDSDADAEEVDMDMARLASSSSGNPAVPGLSKLRTHSEIGSTSTTTSPARSKLGARAQSHQPPSTSTTEPKERLASIDTRLELPPGDETDAVMAALLEAANSPQEETERSKRWVEEEGEVFRKSTKLGVVQGQPGGAGPGNDGADVQRSVSEGRLDLGDSVSGDVLKQEILDTEVARDHERRVIALTDDDDNDAAREDESK